MKQTIKSIKRELKIKRKAKAALTKDIRLLTDLLVKRERKEGIDYRKVLINMNMDALLAIKIESERTGESMSSIVSNLIIKHIK